MGIERPVARTRGREEQSGWLFVLVALAYLALGVAVGMLCGCAGQEYRSKCRELASTCYDLAGRCRVIAEDLKACDARCGGGEWR